MIVACSTLCFGKYPLERALQTIAELGFSKVDVAIHEAGPHLRPSEVAADVHTTAARLRLGPGLTPCAFSVAIDSPDLAGYAEHLAAVCRLARLSSVPTVTVTAASAGTGLDAEARRLKELTAVAARDGVMLCVASFILWSVVFLTMGYQGTSAAGVGGGFAAFFLWLFFGVFHFVWAMCVISGCAWLLLALDAARNLRRIRIKLPYRP